MMLRKKKTIVRDYTGKRLNEKTPFAVQEAFRAMRANIIYASADHGKRAFGVTSAHAGEGKSLIIANLALSFAMLEKKVLLIDADMRCPAQQMIFADELGRDHLGLTEYLAGVTKNVKDCILSVEGGLSLMPCGKSPPNPAELLASLRMKEMMEALFEEYDFIFVDLPPICEVSDATVLSSLLTGYFLVARAEHCEGRELARAEELLSAAGARLYGVVLNDIAPQKSSYYSKYHYGYGEGK